MLSSSSGDRRCVGCKIAFAAHFKNADHGRCALQFGKMRRFQLLPCGFWVRGPVRLHSRGCLAVDGFQRDPTSPPQCFDVHATLLDASPGLCARERPRHVSCCDGMLTARKSGDAQASPAVWRWWRSRMCSPMRTAFRVMSGLHLKTWFS